LSYIKKKKKKVTHKAFKYRVIKYFKCQE
jgi:hypothetical protein